MPRARTILTPRQTVDGSLHDLMASHDAGEDPRRTIRRLDARIVDCQRAGEDVPASLLRLSLTLAAECVAQSIAR